jgi:hypothetical protein
VGIKGGGSEIKIYNVMGECVMTLTPSGCLISRQIEYYGQTKTSRPTLKINDLVEQAFLLVAIKPFCCNKTHLIESIHTLYECTEQALPLRDNENLWAMFLS